MWEASSGGRGAESPVACMHAWLHAFTKPVLMIHDTRSSSVDRSCLMQDALFGEAYDGGRTAVSPVAFLRAWWHSAGGHLEGYQQQDAHEFYLNALSGLVSAGALCVCVCVSSSCVSCVQGGQNRVVCHLSGYQQQDAHESNLNALSGLVSF